MGLTDPDLTEISSESPTLSRLSRQLILQKAASRGFRLRKGDVKTAFFCLVIVKRSIEMCVQTPLLPLPQELREKLQITREQVLKTVFETRRGHGGNESFVI